MGTQKAELLSSLERQTFIEADVSLSTSDQVYPKLRKITGLFVLKAWQGLRNRITHVFTSAGMYTVLSTKSCCWRVLAVKCLVPKQSLQTLNSTT